MYLWQLAVSPQSYQIIFEKCHILSQYCCDSFATVLQHCHCCKTVVFCHVYSRIRIFQFNFEINTLFHSSKLKSGKKCNLGRCTACLRSEEKISKKFILAFKKIVQTAANKFVVDLFFHFEPTVSLEQL